MRQCTYNFRCVFLSISCSTFYISYLLNPEGNVRQCTYNFRFVFLSISCSTFFLYLLSLQSRGQCEAVHIQLQVCLSFYLIQHLLYISYLLNPEGHMRQCTYNVRFVFLSISCSAFFAPSPILLNPKNHVWQCRDIVRFVFLSFS